MNRLKNERRQKKKNLKQDITFTHGSSYGVDREIIRLKTVDGGRANQDGMVDEVEQK